MSEWIRVEDRMPDIDEYVLFYQKNGQMFYDHIDKDGYIFVDVTHWQSIEPPKGHSND